MHLYRKYRPSDFDQMVGNEEQVKILNNFMKSRDTQVFLFTGPSGCGKTTAARICADKLGVGPLSLIELNSANNRGIETAREIIERMRYNPADSDYVVYIIDEVHKTTKDWQDAMLKPLEDTPAHVYFFLCTTDPQMLLKTLKSRCTEIKFNSIHEEDILFLLKKINREEKLKIGKKVLEEISENCNGSARDSLVLLDSVSQIEDEGDQIKVINDGVDLENAEVIELCRALINENTTWHTVAKIIKNMDIKDPEKVRYAVLGYMSAVLLSGKANDRAAITIENFSEPFYNSGKSGLILASYQTLVE